MNKSIFAIAIIATNAITFSVTKMFLGNQPQIAAYNAEENKYLPLVQTYYEVINTPPSEKTPEILNRIVSPEWVANPVLSGGNGVDGIIKTLGSHYNVMPNIKTNIQEVLSSGERVIVRTVITATPSGQFMGASATQGKSFSINAIDIHTVKDGKLVELQHSQDWSDAIKQVADAPQALAELKPATPAADVPQVPSSQPAPAENAQDKK